jgi:hypothetical protein
MEMGVHHRFNRKPDPNDHGRMLVSCGQIGCDWKERSVSRTVDGTNNYRQHYASKHLTFTLSRLEEAARKKNPEAGFFERRPRSNILSQGSAVDAEENSFSPPFDRVHY